MKPNTLPEKDDNIRRAHHEMQSTLAGILTSVELIDLYNQVDKSEKISRQIEAIKSQVILLEKQITNITNITP